MISGLFLVSTLIFWKMLDILFRIWWIEIGSKNISLLLMIVVDNLTTNFLVCPGTEAWSQTVIGLNKDFIDGLYLKGDIIVLFSEE